MSSNQSHDHENENNVGTISYPPLEADQIRLLIVQSDKTRAANIRCELKVITLGREADQHQTEYYEALSWCWGDPNDRKPITVNGQRFDVPVNLEQALRQLRKPDEDLYLWIDAICIDQSNLPEKEVQIGMMARIYSRASQVRVWLGISDHESRHEERKYYKHQGGSQAGQTDHACLAIELLSQGVPFNAICHRLLEWPSKWLPMRQFFNACEKDPRYREAGDAFLSNISSIFQRPWWSRLWVVQEVILGSVVVMQISDWTIDCKTLLAAYNNFTEEVAENFRKLELGFTTFFDFVAMMDNTFRPLQANRRLFKGLSEVGEQDPDARKNLYLGFIELLASCRTRRATVARDKLYGLLGMAPKLVGDELAPSYSTPEREVFCKAAYQILQSSKSFMLVTLRTFESSSSKLPSWVPSWDLDYEDNDLTVMSDLSLRRAQEEIFSACGNIGWEMELLNDEAIRVKGFRLDKISYRKTKMREATDDLYAYTELEHVLDDLYYCYGKPGNVRGDSFEARERVLKSVYPSGVTVSEALSRTAINDCIPCADKGASHRVTRPSARDLIKLAAWFKGVMAPYTNNLVLRLATSISFDSGSREQVGKVARSVMLSRAFLATELGYIGLTDGDEKCEEGDEIWILAGGSHPVVLRPVAGERQRYRVLTEAYVHGVMDGEVVLGNSPILPVDDSPLQCRKDVDGGRTNWPIPEWSHIQLE